jgi:hypothetical protein
MAIKIKGTTIINDETLYIDLAGNSAVKVPAGPGSTRPAGVEGLTRFNTESKLFEGYNGVEWGPLTDIGTETEEVTVLTVLMLG